MPQCGEGVFDQTVPDGHVVAIDPVDPVVRTQVEEGSTVVLTVSAGPAVAFARTISPLTGTGTAVPTRALRHATPVPADGVVEPMTSG